MIKLNNFSKAQSHGKSVKKFKKFNKRIKTISTSKKRLQIVNMIQTNLKARRGNSLDLKDCRVKSDD